MIYQGGGWLDRLNWSRFLESGVQTSRSYRGESLRNCLFVVQRSDIRFIWGDQAGAKTLHLVDIKVLLQLRGLFLSLRWSRDRVSFSGIKTADRTCGSHPQLNRILHLILKLNWIFLLLKSIFQRRTRWNFLRRPKSINRRSCSFQNLILKSRALYFIFLERVVSHLLNLAPTCLSNQIFEIIEFLVKLTAVNLGDLVVLWHMTEFLASSRLCVLNARLFVFLVLIFFSLFVLNADEAWNMWIIQMYRVILANLCTLWYFFKYFFGFVSIYRFENEVLRLNLGPVNSSHGPFKMSLFSFHSISFLLPSFLMHFFNWHSTDLLLLFWLRCRLFP